MAVKASFGNPTDNQNRHNQHHKNKNYKCRNNNDSGNYSDDDTAISNNYNDYNDINMYKEESYYSPCWSSYWKFLQPQDELWIVNDNARSHETRRFLNRQGSSSPEVHWDPTKDSVVGFCNAKTNRWGVSPSPLVPPLVLDASTTTIGSNTSTTSPRSTITTPTNATPTNYTTTTTNSNNSNSSSKIPTCSTEPVTRHSLESTTSQTTVDENGSVRQDSLLMQPARRESLVILDPIDLGPFLPERRVSEDSVLTFRTSIGSSTMGTFESILEDVCDDSDLDDDDDDVDDDDDDDDDDNKTKEDKQIELASHRFQSNAQYPKLPGPPLRRVQGVASDTSSTSTSTHFANGQPDGSRRFAPIIRGSSLPNLEHNSRNTMGPSVPVRRSSACSVAAADAVRAFHTGSSSTSTKRLSNFEAILEYEPMEDLPSSVNHTLSRESSTDDDDDDIDRRWIEAGNETKRNAFTLVPTDSLRLARHSTTLNPSILDVQHTPSNEEQGSRIVDHNTQQEPALSSSKVLPDQTEQVLDEEDQCHSRSSLYSPKVSNRQSIHSASKPSDGSSVKSPSTSLTRTDSVELGLTRCHKNKNSSKKAKNYETSNRQKVVQKGETWIEGASHSKVTNDNDDDDDDDGKDGGSQPPPPLVGMVTSPSGLFHKKCAIPRMENMRKKVQAAIPALDTEEDTTPKMTQQTKKQPWHKKKVSK